MTKIYNLKDLVDRKKRRESGGMSRDRVYNGQPHTDDGVRGKTKVVGLTMRDINDCLIRAFCQANGVDNPVEYNEAQKGEKAELTWDSIYAMVGDVSPMALGQNLTCEIERMMGIYPNIPEIHINHK